MIKSLLIGTKNVGLRFANRIRLRRLWRSADVVLISFPKCGRTWLRMMIGNAAQEYAGKRMSNPIDIDSLHRLDRLLPNIHVTHYGHPDKKTPEEIDVGPRKYAGKKVILLVREPKDVMVSLYFQKSRRERSFEGTIGEFIRCRRGSIESFIKFYQMLYDDSSGMAGIHVVRYEDMLEDALAVLQRVLVFAGFPEIEPARLERAVEKSSFERMREAEGRGIYRIQALVPGDVADEESFKVRRGQSGGHRQYLNRDEIAYLDSRVPERFRSAFGY